MRQGSIAGNHRSAGGVRRWSVILTAAAVLLATTGASLITDVGPAAASTGLSTTPPTMVCGVANPASMVYSGSGPTHPVTTLVSGLSPWSFTEGNNQLYELDNGTKVNVYSLTGSPVSSIALPFNMGNSNQDMVVGPDGSLYLYGGATLYKLSASGSVLWQYPLSITPNGLFAWHDTGGNFAVGVILRGQATGPLINAAGAQDGIEPVPGTANSDLVTPQTGGGFDVTDGDYVYEYNSSGVRTFTFGNATAAGSSVTPGAPFAFYQGGGAVQVGSTVYVADAGDPTEGHGIDAFSTQGYYRGTASNSTVNVGGPSPLELVGTTLYYIDGSSLASISESNLAALVAETAAPVQGGFGDTLGIGAGIVTPATAGYFAPGTTPAVSATFDPWWETISSHLSLSYQVMSSTQITGNSWPAATTVAVTAGTTGSSGITLPIVLPAADTTPGVYEVNADLVDTSTSTTIGSTCLTYSVGATGDTLNFSGLAAGEDAGGPAPVRAVQEAATFGTGLAREGLDWGTLLPNCNSGAVTAAACGPASLSFSSYDPETGQAAAEAKALGVKFEVLVATGGPVDTAVVNFGNGLWQQDVQAIAAHFASSAPDLTYLEAWNEPNNTWGSATTYVTQILAPFYAGVKAADAADGHTDLVIGGTVCGMEMNYWNSFAAAGGFAHLDVVGTHPYTGYDDSYEEDNIPPLLSALVGLMASNGAAAKPLWDTEQGWWSNTHETYYDAGNWAARAWMWNKSVGITTWNYFITEGAFSSSDQSYSLIQAGAGINYVKPDGIALMTVSSLLGSRPYLGTVATGIPHAYAMLFGPAPGTTTDVLAAWTDDLTMAADATLSAGVGPVAVPTTGVLGQAGSLTVAAGTQTPITLSGAPTYLTVPQGDTLALAPAESFGSDLALGSGVSAAATSSVSGNGPSLAIRSMTSNGSIVPDATTDTGADYGGWRSTPTDTSPSLTVTFPSAKSVDRVVVATATLGSTMPGLRTYQVQADEGGTWTTVATTMDEFYQRMSEMTFPAVTATGIRLLPQATDYNDSAAGLEPWFWSPSWTSTPAVYAVEAYGPGSAPTGNLSPVVATVSPAAGPQAGGTTVTVSGTNLTGTTGVSFGATPATSFSVTSGTSLTAVAPAGTGTDDITVTGAGGTSTTSSSDRFTYVAAPAAPAVTSVSPAVTSVSPAAGPQAGGTTVTVSGTNLTGTTGVSFGATPAISFSVTSGTSLTAVAPAGTGTDDITVTGAGGTSTTSSSDRFAYQAAPVLAGVSPSSGASGGGTTVTLTGTGLAGATAVDFGGVPAISMTAVSATSVRAVSPSGTGIVPVTVTTAGGTSLTGRAAFTYNDPSGPATPANPATPATTPPGYWEVASDGGIFSFGGARFYGSTGSLTLNRPIVGMTATPDDKGYWLVASDGGVFAFGDAGYYGSTGSLHLNRPVVGMTATPDGGGYWLVASDGGLFAFGDAGYYGSTGSLRLNRPVVGMASTPDGRGYWLVANDGGLFAFGDAAFHGSAAGTVSASIVAMATSRDGHGYWMVGSDGAVYPFGSAVDDGQATGSTTGPVVGIVTTRTGGGYWVVAADGGIFTGGDAPFLGSMGGRPLNRPIVGMA